MHGDVSLYECVFTNYNVSSFIFFSAKKQRHNMVHVEVWAGDGDKTIGARWQHGK